MIVVDDCNKRSYLAERPGFEAEASQILPTVYAGQHEARTGQVQTQPLQNQTPPKIDKNPSGQSQTTAGHEKTTGGQLFDPSVTPRGEGVGAILTPPPTDLNPIVSQPSSPAISIDLLEVVQAWPNLPAPLKAGIMAMVRAATGKEASANLP